MTDKQSFSMLPIKRTDVFQEVINRIEAMIDGGACKPGERFPSERELAESLGVSRTSIRQALKVLEAAGKVETRIGSGTYVAEERGKAPDDLLALLPPIVDKTFLRQLVAARRGIERAVFEECCDCIDDIGLSSLYTLIADNARDFARFEPDENVRLDLGFESKVAELARNPILFHMQRNIHQLWLIAWNAFGYAPENMRILHAEHLEMLAALERRDKERVIKLIVHHVNRDIP